jgi:hypothetical protein
LEQAEWETRRLEESLLALHDTANQMLLAQQDAEKRGSISIAKFKMTEAKLK